MPTRQPAIQIHEGRLLRLFEPLIYGALSNRGQPDASCTVRSLIQAGGLFEPRS